MDEFDDTKPVSADTANVVAVTTSNEDDAKSESSVDDGNDSDSSTDYARVLHYNYSSSDDDGDKPMIEKLIKNDAYNASLNIEEYPNTTLDKNEADIEALMLMYATSPKETHVKKRFVDCSLGATYKIKSNLAITIEVTIPTTITAAINDEHFSYQ